MCTEICTSNPEADLTVNHGNWEGSMSREWLALVEKGNKNENFSPSSLFSIKLHFLAMIAFNHRVLFIV